LHASSQFGASLNELKRGNEVELADLTRGMQKNTFLDPEKVFCAKPGLSEFHKSSAEKKIRA
jgi:hypothetical protein